jgi:Replication-relaxation
MPTKTNLMNTAPGEKRRRQSPLKRAEKQRLPPFRPTTRDFAIVAAVYEYKALTTEHIAALLFTPTTLTKGDERLRKLFDHGFLLRTEQPASILEKNTKLVHWLDWRGVELHAHTLGVDPSALDWKPNRHKVGPQFLYHLLDTNTVRIAIRKAAEALGMTVVAWKAEDMLRSEAKMDNSNVIPDDYFLLEQPLLEEQRSRILRLFIEIDRRTVTGEAKASALSQRDWAHRIQGYNAYFRSDAYSQRYGSVGGKPAPARVLTITTGEKRAQHLREITEKNAGKSRYWFTTFDNVKPETILVNPATILTAPIWTVASWAGVYSLTDTKSRNE